MHLLYQPPRPAAPPKPFDLPNMPLTAIEMCDAIYRQVVAAGYKMDFMRVGCYASEGAPSQGDGLCVGVCESGILLFCDGGKHGFRFLFASYLLQIVPRDAKPGDHLYFYNDGMKWILDVPNTEKHRYLIAMYTSFCTVLKKQKPKVITSSEDDVGAPPAMTLPGW